MALKILVVEDSLAVRKRLSMALEGAGFSVDSAANGKEAWNKTRRVQFDFVVTDEQMPLMTGQELCRRLRTDERYASVPVFFLTGDRSKLDVNELLGPMEVAGIFDKPFNPQTVVRSIENQRLMGQKR